MFSGYSLQALVTISIIAFGIHFLSFWWALAYWVDNQFFRMFLASVEGIGQVGENSMQATLTAFMSRFLYMVFPAFYLAALGWAGIRGANAVGGVVDTVGSRSGEVGGAGASVIQSVATKGKA